MHKKCSRCGKDFYVPKNRFVQRRYCSGACRKQRYTLSCEVCGKTFEAYRSEIKNGFARYCSQKCFGISVSARINLICQECSNEFSIPVSSAKKGRKFCSKKCYLASRNPKSNSTCGNCGKPIYIRVSQSKLGKGKYCSVRCNALGRKKPVEVVCEVCKKIVIIRPSLLHKFRFCSRGCKDKWQKTQVGDKAMNWRGGISKHPYPPEFDGTFRLMIRRRDNYRCAICGDRGLDVHHIDYNKKHTAYENCITLCHSCHGKTNSDRERWKKHFMNVIYEHGYDIHA